MSRDGSDWDYINEHLGGHDEDGLPNFMSEPGFSDDYKIKEEPCFFETFQDAKNWAIKNSGKAFTRSPNGQGFVPNNHSGRYNNFPANKRDNSPIKQANRFLGLEGFESSKILRDVLARLSPHLLYRYTKAPSNFSKNTFIQELNKLSKEEIQELKMVLTEYVEIDKQKLKGLESFIHQYRKDPSKYGVAESYQWINDLEVSIDLMH